MTETATDVVKKITEQTANADAAGLRISKQGAEADSFALAPVEAPEPGDHVLEKNGARIFLDEGAAVTLDNQVLDAQIDQEGGVQFAVGTQG